jgi:septal ring factor EnvC (AmiA/AmiB activator)
MTRPAPPPPPTTVDKQVFGMDMKVLGGFAMLIYFGSQQLSDIKNDIARLKEAPEKVQAIDERQRTTDQAVKELQTGFHAMAADMKTIKSDLQVMGGQINQIATRMPRQ